MKSRFKFGDKLHNKIFQKVIDVRNKMIEKIVNMNIMTITVIEDGISDDFYKHHVRRTDFN